MINFTYNTHLSLSWSTHLLPPLLLWSNFFHGLVHSLKTRYFVTIWEQLRDCISAQFYQYLWSPWLKWFRETYLFIWNSPPLRMLGYRIPKKLDPFIYPCKPPSPSNLGTFQELFLLRTRFGWTCWSWPLVNADH